MNVEENRLNTFAEWPANAAVEPRRLARAGFYYTGIAQEVQCFLCGTKISKWNYGDFAMRQHRQAAPDCPFVCNPSATCNVPLVPTPVTTTSTSPTAEALHENNSTENATSAALHRSENPRVEYGTFAQRLKSFVNWPIPNIVSPHDLAKAGFYYLQYEDVVECAYCEGVVFDWEAGDDPDKDHRINFPNCDFYMHRDKDADRLELNNVTLMSGTEADLSELGIQVCTPPRTPEYSTYEQRICTFRNWSEHFKQSKEQLAMAGFYYEGHEDHVRCFHCNGGLRNWEDTDDVWVEHARWYPKCEYVALICGTDFIRQCIRNRKPLDPSIFEGIPEDEFSDMIESPMPSSSVVSPPVQETSSGIRPEDNRNERDSEIPTEGAAALRVVEGTLDDCIHREPTENGIRNQSEPSPSDLATVLNKISIEDTNRDTERQCSNVGNTRTDLKASEGGGKRETLNENNRTSENVSAEKSSNIASLEEQNRRLREARLCKICMHMEVAIVLLPCGHLSTCTYCTSILTHCPMCRQEIRATVRAFFS